MKRKSLFSGAMIAAFALSIGTFADDETKDKEMTRGEKRLEKIKKEYAPTGETKTCVRLRFLRDSKIIDDKTIFFESVGKTAYMNNMKHRCGGLAREERFMYSTSIAQLCRGEIITVLDSFGRQWGSCGLGDFEVWEKIDKDKDADKEGNKDDK